MISPRWRKVLADIAEHPVRSVLAVLAMAAGVFGVGFILTAYGVLGRELARTYAETRPASVILYLDAVAPALVDSVRAMPGVAEAESRAVLRGQVRAGGHAAPLVLFVVPDFADVRLDKFRHEAGAWPPDAGSFLVERSALQVTGARLGDRVTVHTAGGLDHEVRIAGSVHAPGLPPGWMDHVVTGFIGEGSILRADSTAESAALRVLVAERPLERAHIADVAQAVRARLEATGHRVRRVMLGALPGSTMLAPHLLEGRWITSDDETGVVVSQATLRALPGLTLGDTLHASLRGRPLAWLIVGVVRELNPSPTAYATPAVVRAATGDADSLARGARIVLAAHTEAAQRAGAASVQRALEGAGIEGASVTPLLERSKAFADHLVIIYSALLLAALLLAALLVIVVGGIGLTSTLLLNVFERTREIGILRAIGAAPRVIARNVVIEGIALGVLSWGASLVVAVPFTAAFDALTGRMFINAPVDLVLSWEAAAAWLGLVVVLAVLGSLYPAWRAARLTVREALAHE